MIGMAMLTYMERKVIAAMQLRKGPNIRLLGADATVCRWLKALAERNHSAAQANKVVFILAPMVTFSLALLGWAVIPLSATYVIADINVGMLYLFAMSSLGVYGVIMAGWASNSKYAFLGAIRSSAQMVSYEVSIGLCHCHRTTACWLAESRRYRAGAGRRHA